MSKIPDSRLLHKCTLGLSRKRCSSRELCSTYCSTKMNADSTTTSENHFLRSWNSAETIGALDSNILCSICKCSITHIDDEHLLLQTVNRTIGGQVFIFKSIIVVKCKDCDSVTHFHCENNHIESDTSMFNNFVSTLPYTCTDCRTSRSDNGHV